MYRLKNSQRAGCGHEPISGLLINIHRRRPSMSFAVAVVSAASVSRTQPTLISNSEFGLKRSGLFVSQFTPERRQVREVKLAPCITMKISSVSINRTVQKQRTQLIISLIESTIHPFPDRDQIAVAVRSAPLRIGTPFAAPRRSCGMSCTLYE